MSSVTARPVQQDWVLDTTLMQQTVLFAAIRAPDGMRKNHPVKVLMRWYRRCILLSAFDKKAITDPFSDGGGSFTGPFTKNHAMEILQYRPRDLDEMNIAFNNMRGVYLEHVDEMPHHFQLHFMHAIQIVGAHHPDPHIKFWWFKFYSMIVNDAHLHMETDEEMNLRLSDNPDEWRKREVVVAR